MIKASLRESDLRRALRRWATVLLPFCIVLTAHAVAPFGEESDHLPRARPAQWQSPDSNTSVSFFNQLPLMAADSRMASVKAPPQGITAEAWLRITADIEQRTYSIRTTGEQHGHLVADNPAQHLEALFDSAGVELIPAAIRCIAAPKASLPASSQPLRPFRMRTSSVNGVVVSPTIPVSTGNRVDYAHAGFTEWYVNDAKAFEQGWTLEARPKHGGSPIIQMEIEGARTIAEADGAIRVEDHRGQVHYRYADLAAWDAVHRALPVAMHLERDGLIQIEVNDRNAQYPIVVDPALTETQAVHLTDPVTTANDEFGVAVSIDGNTMAVGAKGTSGGQGKVYLYDRNQGGAGAWGLEATLSDPAATSNDDFGSAVSLRGDTLVVGAFATSGTTPYEGKAYVFYRDKDGAGTWGLVATLSESNCSYFGISVALDGDTLVVGSAGPSRNEGQAYIFSRNQGGTDEWGLLATLPDPGAVPGDGFGYAVAISGDTVVIGAEGIETIGLSGTAYVFSRNHGGQNTWGLVAHISDPRGVTGDNFGNSVSVDGDTIAVGAFGWATVGNPGAAYVYSRSQGGPDAWGLAATLNEPTTGGGDNFGSSVSVRGDFVAVGASGANSTGKVYLFNRNQNGAGAWGLAAGLAYGASTTGSQFGGSVAMDGETLVVGSSGAKSGGGTFVYDIAGGAFTPAATALKDPVNNTTDAYGVRVAADGDTAVVADSSYANNSGKVYVYSRNQNGPGAWGLVASAVDPAAAANDLFGTTLALKGDVLVVGAAAASNRQGIAYIFSRDQGGTDAWGRVATLTDPSAISTDYFGGSAAIDGDTVVIGAWGANNASGMAYVYSRNQNGADAWGLVSSLADPAATANDVFGGAVAVRGNTLTVGANGTAGLGRAYVFNRDQIGTQTWRLTATLADSGATNGEEFGARVAMTSDTIVVGAPHANSDRGKAFIFSRNQNGNDGWGQIAALKDPRNISGDSFGSSVAIDGDTAAIGTWGGGDGTQDKAYVFNRNKKSAFGSGGTETWSLVATLANPMAASKAVFNADVAVNGETVVMGVPGQTNLYDLNTDIPAEVVSTYLLSFPSQGIGTLSNAKSITLSNPGSGKLQVNSVSLSGTDAGSFVISANHCTSSVQAGGQCTIEIEFAPSGTAAGIRSASLKILSNAPEGPTAITLSGSAITSPLMTLSGGSGSFGNQAVGTIGSQTYSILNNGTASLSVGSPNLSGTNLSDYAIASNTCINAIAINQSCAISVTFTPTATGARTATLSIPSNAPSSPNLLPLTGTGV